MHYTGVVRVAQRQVKGASLAHCNPAFGWEEVVDGGSLRSINLD